VWNFENFVSFPSPVPSTSFSFPGEPGERDGGFAAGKVDCSYVGPSPPSYIIVVHSGPSTRRYLPLILMFNWEKAFRIALVSASTLGRAIVLYALMYAGRLNYALRTALLS